MYKKDALREYIMNSELRILSNNIRVRLSKELAKKYDKGYYDIELQKIQKYFNLVNDLNLKFPGNATPIFYIYIVPDDNYVDLLKFQNIYNVSKGGGKTVKSYDLDGFNSAYGLSQNMLENRLNGERIEEKASSIHEIAHVIHSQFFFNTNICICEGFAETLPLYTFDLEQQFTEHREIITSLNEAQIFTVQEMLDSEKNGTFGKDFIIPSNFSTFRKSYISSYLFVRGCLEIISSKFNLNRISATQKFLEIIKQSDCTNEWLIFDIADYLEIPRDELLNGKKIQMQVIDSLVDKNKKSL